MLRPSSDLCMPNIEYTKRFWKDVQRWERSGKGIDPLHEFLRMAQDEWPLPAKYEAHLLAGPMEGIWDIHIRQNWIVLMEYHAGTITLLRMGTHAELGL